MPEHFLFDADSTNPLATDKKPPEPTLASTEYAAGTTWVFDDFSTAGGELVITGKGDGEGARSGAEQGSDDGAGDIDSFMEDLEGVVDI